MLSFQSEIYGPVYLYAALGHRRTPLLAHVRKPELVKRRWCNMQNILCVTFQNRSQLDALQALR